MGEDVGAGFVWSSSGPGIVPDGARTESAISNGITTDGMIMRGGEEEFRRFVTEEGADPAVLRADLPALLEFLAEHAELLDRPAVVESASVFLGEAIIVNHPYAQWSFASEPEVAGPGTSLVIAPITRDIVAGPAAGQHLLDTLADWPQLSRDEDELDALYRAVSGHRIEPVVGFRLPAVQVPIFRDPDGAVIDYGDRYPDGPPDEAYSRTSHPERFAPLHDVADAVVDFLVRRYVVSIEDRRRPRGRAVQLRAVCGAPVIITYTDHPGLDLEAGEFFQARYPSCGCDACDETADPLADEFVEQLFGIVGGGLSEHYPVGSRRWSHSALTTADGRSAGAGEPSFGPEDERRVITTLAELDDGRWPPWPLRSESLGGLDR